jgi:hypothetical protein
LAIPDIYKQSLSGALSMVLPHWNLRLEIRDLSRPWHNMRWLPFRSAIARKCNLNSRLRLPSIEEQSLGVTESSCSGCFGFDWCSLYGHKALVDGYTVCWWRFLFAFSQVSYPKLTRRISEGPGNFGSAMVSAVAFIRS